MDLIAIREASACEAATRRVSRLTLSDRLPIATCGLDAEGYDPLASIAHEISRELGGDGLLVTWHEEDTEPRFLFANGVCETQSDLTCDIANMGERALTPRLSGPRSHWRTLANHPSAGVLTTSFPTGRGVITIAALFKRLGRSTRMNASETAARLVPLIQPFFRTWLLGMKASAKVSALTTVINNGNVGVLLLDRAGQLMFVNSVAEELLGRGDGLRRKGTTIASGSMTDTLRLHTAIEQATTTDIIAAGKRDNIVALRRQDRRPLIAAVAPSTAQYNGGTDCAVIIYVVDPDLDIGMLIEPICSFYQLTRAESRLARLLVDGLSLADAAARLEVREQTARTCLKQIFLKTDTNRQAELVRLMLLSAVRTGDPPRVGRAVVRHP